MTEEVKNSPIADFDWEAYANGETKGEKDPRGTYQNL